MIKLEAYYPAAYGKMSSSSTGDWYAKEDIDPLLQELEELRSQRIILSDKDWDRFVAALNSVEPPNDALIEAAQRFNDKK